MSTQTAPAPTSNFTAYRQCCAEQAVLPPEKWTFKRDHRYRRILEHVTREQGEVFLDVAREAAGPLWPAVLELLPRIAAENDRYGMPLVATFNVLGGLTCSPSNLRYLAHAMLIWRHVTALGLSDFHVVELGGGYGGLALYLERLRDVVHLYYGAYTMVDVPEAVALQRSYAKANKVPFIAVDGLDANALRSVVKLNDNQDRYCVSAYAFSEFDRDTQEWYRERLVRHCAHGFMVWNFALPLEGIAEKPLGGPLYPFVEAPLTVEPERPLTGEGNMVVTW